MFELFNKVLHSLLVQLLCLFLLLHQVLTQSRLLVKLDLEHTNFGLFFFLASVFSSHDLLKLTDLDSLHIDSMLELQGLLLKEQVRIPGIIELSPQHEHFLLENLLALGR
mmetsp:Transcript_46631/g.61735  ORF Transcript_46631/g.61735 Transcript_46631/m.61735 type:complete len:110 (-) Transcript_46631:58-387(-)